MAIVLDILRENFDEVLNAFNDVDEDEQEELKDHFNQVSPELGDKLFGDDIDDFTTKVQGLNEDEQDQFVEALKEAELLDYQ